MASPPLTEDERRLLREYRLTKIPHRKQNPCPVKPQREKKQQQELSSDELNQILGLVSELNYIKLVPTIDENKPNQTSKATTPTPTPIATTMTNSVATTSPTTATTLATTDDVSQAQGKINCEPYIFNKVDYLQKLSIRKKAMKKLKKLEKAKNKSRKRQATPTQNLRNLEA